MIDLFQPAAADRSIAYLREIFGHMGGVLSGGLGGSDGAASSITLLGTMFSTFNTIVLGVGALILVYVTVVGVVKTAHEGEMMGKQWSSLWVPLRMVLGIASLIPANAGFSTLQVVMMWVIVQGVGAADNMWNTVLGYVEVVGSPTAQVTILQTGADAKFQALYQGLVCDATFREKQANPGEKGYGEYYCSKNAGSSFCKGELEFDRDPSKSSLELGPGGACGTLTYCNEAKACEKSDSLKCSACKVQKEALEAIVTGPVKDVAKLLVQYDYSYRNFYYNNSTFAGTDFNKPDWILKYCGDKEINAQNCCVPGAGQGDAQCNATTNNFSSLPPNQPSNKLGSTNASEQVVQDLYWSYGVLPELQDAGADFLGISKSFYFNSLTKNVLDYVQLQRTKLESGGGNQLFIYARQTGWIMAGTLYYLIAKENNNNLDDASPSFSMKSPDETITTGQGRYSELRTNYATAKELLDAASAAADAASGKDPDQTEDTPAGGASKTTSSALKDASSAFMNNVAPDKSTTRINPLIALQQLGYSLLLIVFLLWVALIILMAVLGGLSTLSPLVLGTGLAGSPAEGAMLYVWTLMLPALLGLFGVMITVGGLFAVYVPLIPYVFFTMGAVGWFLSVIEAMVAGPLVALGILMPGGQNEMLGKAEPSLMLLFSIFLRPTLMIFGLVASMLLASVVVDLINAGFGLVITSIADVGNAGGIAYDAAGKPYIRGGAAALAFNPIMLVIILCAYTMLIVTALNKCFSAIHVIPEKVMRWIGGQGEQYGEAESMGQVKGGIESGQRGVEGAQSGAKGGIDSAAPKIGSKEQAEHKAKQAGKADASGKNPDS